MLEPCWHYFSLLGASWTLWALLAAFVLALGRFLCPLNRFGLVPGSILEGFWEVLEVQNVDFSRFLRTNKTALRKCSDPYKTLAGATKIKVFYISRVLRGSKKTIKTRTRSLSNSASHKDRLKNWSSGSRGSILEGSGAILGGSWPAFGCSWASLGPSWALLGRSWGASCAILGVSWLICGVS